MYLDYYQLRAKPFQITADPKFLWLGDKHKEALATLRYGIVDNRGFLLLTGEVGTGKTMLINRLCSLLDIDTVVATLPDPDLNSMDFYNLLADGLQMKRTFDSKGAFLIHLRDFLHQSHADQKQVLLIIDESQRLNHKLMEDIRVLSNIELQDRKLINIFFVGQQEFNSILMAPSNRALSQRITVRYHIEPLNQEETGQYVDHRLKVAGRDKPVFKKAALSEIFHFSGGIPRLINIICDHAMLTGYSRNLKRIDASVIKECAEELRIPMQMSIPIAATIMPPKTAETAMASSPVRKNREKGELPGSGPSKSAGPVPQADGDPEFSMAWKWVYALIVLGLAGAVLYGVTQFSGGGTNRYTATDLTPQRYNPEPETENAPLTDRLDEPATDMAGQVKPAQLKNPDRSASKTKLPIPKAPTPATAASALSQSPSGTAAVSDISVGSTANKETSDPGKAGKAPAAETPPEAVDQPKMAMPTPAEEKVGPAHIGKMTESRSFVQAVIPGKPGLTLETTVPSIEAIPLLDEKITIGFEINSNEIEAKHYELLDRVAAYLLEHPQKVVRLRGYTDASGSPGYNMSVSRFRASAVKSYLIGKGARPGQLDVIAMGDQNPIASNDRIGGRVQNRRVEIEFADKNQEAE
jgi:general secretion pathway protein A